MKKLKILLINNKESAQLSLEKFLQNYGTLDVIHFQSISIWAILKTYIFTRPDLIVLSGSGDVPLNFSLDLYRDELDLIKTTNFPVIGVCFGFEAIACAYDEELVKNDTRIKGIYEIDLKENNEKFSVWQSHLWCLKSCKNLKVLAESQNGVEMVKVPGKDIYGLQFHPEYEDQNNKGKILFEKVLKDIFLFD
jgi:GMP synthase-like glutamine amidotransferase